MTVSEKQLEANKQNALKGGVKSEEGKAIVKYNALKHGLLAKEVVITAGDGAENPEEFSGLLDDLGKQLQPQGTLEELLVEKIAVSYWRLRRACRYETGLIRHELDNATNDYYRNEYNKTDEKIEQEIKQEQEQLEEWESDKEQLTAMHTGGKPLEETYDLEGNWDWLFEKVSDQFELDDDNEGTPKEIRKVLNNKAGWSDDQIWQAHIELCDEEIKHQREKIAVLRQDIEKNRLKLQVTKKLGCIPTKHELDRLLRYEGAIERQFYKAMNQLERLQRIRSGESIPAPVEVDVDVNSGQGG
jgi:hypothetical protein